MPRVSTERTIEPGQLALEAKEAHKLKEVPEVSWERGKSVHVEADITEDELKALLRHHRADPTFFQPDWKRELKDQLEKGKVDEELLHRYILELLNRELGGGLEP